MSDYSLPVIMYCSFNDVGNLYITNASAKHEGTYVCVALNSNGIDNKFFHVNLNGKINFSLYFTFEWLLFISDLTVLFRLYLNIQL